MDFDRKDWIQHNQRRYSQYGMDQRDRIKAEMVEEYGGKCTGCGNSNPVVLTLDHINDDSYVEKEFFGEGNGRGGHKLYAVLKKQGWPKERFQLLCFNCNAEKEHKRRRETAIERSKGLAQTEISPSIRSGKMEKPAHNSSGVKGVFWNTQKEKWHATILVNYKRVHLGFYDDIRDAARAYGAKAREVWGEAANVATEEEIQAAYELQTNGFKTELSIDQLGL